MWLLLVSHINEIDCHLHGEGRMLPCVRSLQARQYTCWIQLVLDADIQQLLGQGWLPRIPIRCHAFALGLAPDKNSAMQTRRHECPGCSIASH